MNKERCEVTYSDGAWHVLFVTKEQSKGVYFKTWIQALDAANEWTWSERSRGHDVDLLIPPVIIPSMQPATA